jgi:hypothetical protein
MRVFAVHLVWGGQGVFTVLFEPRERVMLTRYSGMLTSEDLSRIDSLIAGFVAREGYVRPIFDLTDVEIFAIPRSKLLERARKLRMNPGQDRVFVVPQPQIHELYREYAQVQLDLGNGGMAIVQTLAEALDRLGLHAPDFEPLARADASTA